MAFRAGHARGLDGVPATGSFGYFSAHVLRNCFARYRVCNRLPLARSFHAWFRAPDTQLFGALKHFSRAFSGRLKLVFSHSQTETCKPATPE